MQLLVISNCPLQVSQGSGYVVLRYATGMRQRGHSLRLFGPEHYEPLATLGGTARSWRLAVGIAYQAIRELFRENIDVIEFYGAESWLAIALLRLFPFRPRLVIHSNGLETHYYQTLISASRLGLLPHPFGRWYQPNPLPLFNWVFRNADALVTVSHADARYACLHRYQPQRRVLALPNPLDSHWLDQTHNPSTERLIGFCGSWLPSKGSTVLTASLTAVLRRHPQWRAMLLGVGEGFEAEVWFPSDILNRLVIIPHEPDKSRLKALYRRMSIACFPTFFESFGLALAEAMSCGVACISTATGFAADLEHEQEALLLPQPPTCLALEAALERLINDPALRHRLGNAGTYAVQPLLWPEAIDQLECFYRDLLSVNSP